MPIDPPEHHPKHHQDDADALPYSHQEPTFGHADIPEPAAPDDTDVGDTSNNDPQAATPAHRQHEKEQERTGAPRIGQGSAALQSGYSSATMSTASESDDFDWDDTNSEDSADNDSDVPTSKQLAATNGLGGGTRKKHLRARRGRALYLLCMSLARPVRLGLLGVLGTVIALIPFILAITLFKTSPAYGQLVTWSVWIAIIYSSSCATFLVLDLLPSFIMRLAIAVYGRAPEIFKTYVELLTATLFYFKLVLCVSWAWMSFGGVLAISFAHSDRPGYFVWVNRTIASLFGTSIVLLAEKILLQFVAINFHKTAYRDRLEKNALGLRALDKLHESKYIVAEQSRRDRAAQSGTWGGTTGSGGHTRVSTPLWGKTFQFGSSRPPSPGPNAALSQSSHGPRKPSRDGLGEYFDPSTGRAAGTPPAGSTYPPTAQDGQQHEQHHHHHPHIHRHHHHKTDSADHEGKEHHSNENHAKKSEQKTENQSRKDARRARIRQQVQEVISMATMKDSKFYARSRRLGSQQSARKLAKKLFINLNAASTINKFNSHGGSQTLLVVPEKRNFLTADDFIPYFKSEAEAREVFNLFDADRNGDLSKREMREAVQRIYKERRTLSVALKDMSSALGKLDLVLQCIAFCIVVFVWLLIFNRDQTIQNLVPASTFIVAFSFIFSNSAKTVFESMVFIFVTHAYDVGDLVCIDDTWMFVKEFGFISTVFRTVTNQEVVAPNALLSSSKYIHNARRSGTQWETVDVQCGFETALSVIDEFRRRLRAWVKENDREWGGGLDVNYSSLDDMNSVTLTIAFEHKSNWQDWGTRWSRRTKLMRQIKTVAEELQMPAVVERVHGIARPRRADVRRGSAALGVGPASAAALLSPSPASARPGGGGGGALPPLQIPSAPTGRIPFF